MLFSQLCWHTHSTDRESAGQQLCLPWQGTAHRQGGLGPKMRTCQLTRARQQTRGTKHRHQPTRSCLLHRCEIAVRGQKSTFPQQLSDCLRLARFFPAQDVVSPAGFSTHPVRCLVTFAHTADGNRKPRAKDHVTRSQPPCSLGALAWEGRRGLIPRPDCSVSRPSLHNAQ